MKYEEIADPQYTIIREIKIQEVLYNNEITYAVINDYGINKPQATEMLNIALIIINNAPHK